MSQIQTIYKMEIISLTLPTDIMRETCYNMKDVDRGIFLTGCVLQSRFGISISNIVSVRPIYRCSVCGDTTYNEPGPDTFNPLHQSSQAGGNNVCRGYNNQPISSGHEYHRSYEFSTIGENDAYEDACEVEKKARVVEDCQQKLLKAEANFPYLPYLEGKARADLAEAVKNHEESLVTLTPDYRKKNRELYIGEIEFERDDKQRFCYMLSRANWIYRVKDVPLSRSPVVPVFTHEASKVGEFLRSW
jgi:hypothetical protein